MVQTRDHVRADWQTTAEALRRQGEAQLAQQLERFARAMPPVQTDRERITTGLLKALQSRNPNRKDQDLHTDLRTHDRSR